MKKAFLAVIDPSIQLPEIECFNQITIDSTLPALYSLPALVGGDTLPIDDPAGIILMGSASSVHDRLPWQMTLEDWLLPRIEKGIPTLGLCYGHQVIARLFGGKVGFRSADKKQTLGFERVQLASDGLWGEARSGELFVSHREIVTQVPKRFRPTVSRPGLPLDGLAHESLPLWTFQAHPEATTAFLLHRNVAPPDRGRFAFGHSLITSFLDYVEHEKKGQSRP